MQGLQLEEFGRKHIRKKLREIYEVLLLRFGVIKVCSIEKLSEIKALS